MRSVILKKILSLSIVLIATLLTIHAQTLFPKYEFRGVWVATVNNIDWPSRQGLSVEDLKKEALYLLDLHQSHGMNAIILQVRPCSDAMYFSDIEPWSRYLTGIPGKAPEPFFDPLQFWTEESHTRGMELHAWLNPYRLSQNTSEPLAGNHSAFTHPDWVISYGNKLYFDPGIPATRTYVTRVVADIVRRYDIDAIHFDDYFYPYPAGEPFPDDASFAQFNRAFRIDQKDHWRRENVDILIKMLNDSIKSIKPWVKFGISPFGVWRNRYMDPEGSETRAGVTNYDHLYADVRKWLREGWIDYAIPQIYWEIGHPAADFETLLNWWNMNSFDKGLYIGKAPYKLDPNSTADAWKRSDQMPRQVDLTRKYGHIGGSAYFSSKHFRRDLYGFQDSLKSRLYKLPALIPPMPWLKVEKPATPLKIKSSGRRVRWTAPPPTSPVSKPVRYLVYISGKGTPFDAENTSIVQYTGLTAVKFNRRSGRKKVYEVRVSALDRLNNESLPSEPVKLKL